MQIVSPTGRKLNINEHGNRLIDFAPHVLEALKTSGAMNQGDLQEAVWGTSGRGNSTLKVLFQSLVDHGFIKLEKRGRAIWYSIAS